jgi:acyl-CoA thioesterase-1
MAMDFVWQDGDTILFLGDALADEPAGYSTLIPTCVQARYPDRQLTFRTRGMGGNRVGDVVGRLTRDVFGSAPPPTWTLVELGLNDVWHDTSGTPQGRFQDLYRELLLQIRATGSQVACLTTPVVGPELDNEQNRAIAPYNVLIREVAFNMQAPVIDINDALQSAMARAMAAGAPVAFVQDETRLTPQGHLLVALAILGAFHFDWQVVKGLGGAELRAA